jgi:hypothetical protein
MHAHVAAIAATLTQSRLDRERELVHLLIDNLARDPFVDSPEELAEFARLTRITVGTMTDAEIAAELRLQKKKF